MTAVAAHLNKFGAPTVPVAYTDQRKAAAPSRYMVFDVQTNKITAVSAGNGFTLDAPSVSEKFAKLVSAWKKETAHFSITKQQISAMSFLQIVALSDRGLPLIFEELQRRPVAALLVALEAITGENPAKDATSTKEAVTLWLVWGKGNRYVTS